MCQYGKQGSKSPFLLLLAKYKTLVHSTSKYNLKTVLMQVSKSKIREKKWDVVILQEKIEDWILSFENSYF
jgi:hypothetical protein